MSIEEQLHKIPLSPSSPPEIGLKKRHPSDKLNNLPASPPLMSVATKSYVSAYEKGGHQNEMDTNSSPHSPSPSSTFTQPMTQHTNRSFTPTGSSKSIPGLSMVDEEEEEEDQHRDKRQKFDRADSDEGLEPPNFPTRSVQKEQDPVSVASPTQTQSDGQGLNIKRQDTQLLSQDTTLDQLHKDIGEAFLLCRTKTEPQRPNPRKHLLAAYGLSPLLSSVARNDPTTGEKINKLRKSYEGQIKSFGLAGRNKPVKNDRNVDEHEPGALRRLAGILPEGIIPDKIWQEQNATKEIAVTPDFLTKLRQAAELQPGTVRNNAHWEDVLGHEKSRPNPTPPIPIPAITQPTSNGLSFSRTSNIPNIEARRQTRGKKRSYGDESFVGYGEGYSETEDATKGYGDDDAGIRRKRKKDSLSTPLSYGQYLN